MSFYVYVLKCSDGHFYTGHTDNLKQRLNEHNTKKFGGYTSSRLPVELVFSQTFSSRHAAFKAERQIKGWNRKKKEALIRGDWQTICELSNEKNV